MIQAGVSSMGLHSAKLRDLDSGTARPKLPPRALPDSVRSMLKLPGGSSAGGGGYAERPRKIANPDRVVRAPSKGNLRANGGQRKPLVGTQAQSPYTQYANNAMQRL